MLSDNISKPTPPAQTNNRTDGRQRQRSAGFWLSGGSRSHGLTTMRELLPVCVWPRCRGASLKSVAPQRQILSRATAPFEPAIAHFGKAEYPFDDADRILDPGPYFRFSAFDQADAAAVAITAVGEVFGLGACCRIQRAGCDRLGRPIPGYRGRATGGAAPSCRRHWLG
jgi:hypothetical protein